MTVDADRLAKQVDLAYDFIHALHGRVIDLIVDAEAQLARAEAMRCLRPRGYGYCTNALSTSLERPQVQVADYFAVYLRRFEGRIEHTPFEPNTPPIAFLKVVLRERGLTHPEIRFGVLSRIHRAAGRPEERFEEMAYQLAERAFLGPAWIDRGRIEQDYEDAYVSMEITGEAVRLADVPDSEAIATLIVEPLRALFLAAERNAHR